MKNSFLEESSSILSAKMARVDLDETTPQRDSSTEEDHIITPSVHGKTYRLTLKPGLLFCCSETGIKFQVKYPATVSYNLESGRDCMKEINDSGYELVGPLFNITVEPGVVSSVHLPHYLYLEDLGGDKSSIKYGHIKDDGKINFLKPTKIESSYIVLENPTFSRAGAMFRVISRWTLKKKSIPIAGKVLLYFCVMCPDREEFKEYRTHVYLVPCKRADLKELDKVKKEEGFKKIDKPSNTKLIAGNTYTVTAEGLDASVTPKEVQFEMKNDIQNLPFMEINVEGSATSISLKLVIHPDGLANGWTGNLTRADLEHHSARMLKQLMEADDSEKHFVMKHRVDLIDKIQSVAPVVDDLLQKDVLSTEESDTVNSKETSQKKMRALYDFISRLGDKEKDEFYNVLKKRNASVIRNLEAKSETH